MHQHSEETQSGNSCPVCTEIDRIRSLPSAWSTRRIELQKVTDRRRATRELDRLIERLYGVAA